MFKKQSVYKMFITEGQPPNLKEYLHLKFINIFLYFLYSINLYLNSFIHLLQV